jgi:hypothetical protein
MLAEPATMAVVFMLIELKELELKSMIHIFVILAESFLVLIFVMVELVHICGIYVGRTCPTTT